MFSKRISMNKFITYFVIVIGFTFTGCLLLPFYIIYIMVAK